MIYKSHPSTLDRFQRIPSSETSECWFAVRSNRSRFLPPAILPPSSSLCTADIRGLCSTLRRTVTFFLWWAGRWEFVRPRWAHRHHQCQRPQVTRWGSSVWVDRKCCRASSRRLVGCWPHWEDLPFWSQPFRLRAKFLWLCEHPQVRASPQTLICLLCVGAR